MIKGYDSSICIYIYIYIHVYNSYSSHGSSIHGSVVVNQWLMNGALMANQCL